MAWLPISGTLPQYSTANNGLAADYYIKFYASGTTTPINMATDSTGGTTLAKCALSADGYPISNPLDDSTRFIPHIDQDYRIVMYLNETDADNNTTTSAAFNIDGMVLQVVPTGDAANITLRDVTIEEQDDYDRSPLFIDGTDFTAGAGPHVITVPTDWTPTNTDMRFYRLDNSGIVTALTPSSTSSTTFTLAETLLSTDVIFIGDDDFRGFRLATEDYTGGVEKATAAEMNSGASGKFPDAATIATRTATETRTGLVEKATQTEMDNGITNKFPDAAAVLNTINQRIEGTKSFSGPMLKNLCWTSEVLDISVASLPYGAWMSLDGTKVYTFNSGSTGFGLHGWDLPNPYSFVGAVYLGVSSITYINSLRGWDISPDGTRLSIVRSGSTNQAFEATMSTPFDPTTLSNLIQVTTDGANLDTIDISYNGDGSMAFVAYTTNAVIKRYSCPTPYSMNGSTFQEINSNFAGMTNLVSFRVTPDGSNYFSYNTQFDKFDQWSTIRYEPDQLLNFDNIGSVDTTPIIDANDVYGIGLARDSSKMVVVDRTDPSSFKLRIIDIAFLTV